MDKANNFFINTIIFFLICHLANGSTGTPLKVEIKGPASICLGSSATYTLVGSSGESVPVYGYSWKIPQGATIVSGVSTNEVTIKFDAVGIGGLIEVSGNTLAAYLSVNIYSSAPKPGIISGPSTVCKGGTAQFTIDPVNSPNVSKVMWVEPRATVVSSDHKSATVKFPENYENGDLIVYIVPKACTPHTSVKHLTAGEKVPEVPGEIMGSTRVTPGESKITYSIPTIPNATSYDWSLPQGGSIISGNGTNNVTVAFSTAFNEGAIKVRGVNSTCSGEYSLPLPLRFSTVPGDAGPIKGEPEVCLEGDQVLTFSVDPISNIDLDNINDDNRYVWMVSGGSIQPLGNPDAGGDMRTNVMQVKIYAMKYSGNFPLTISVLGQKKMDDGTIAQGKLSSKEIEVYYPVQHISSINGPNVISKGAQGVAYSVNIQPNADTYSWLNPPGTTISLINNNSIQLDFKEQFNGGVLKVAGVSETCGIGEYTELYINDPNAPLLEASPDKNYVIERSSLIPFKNKNNPSYSNVAASQVQYFDALGRPTQHVVHAGSPKMNDLIDYVEYDPSGRKHKQLLTYVDGLNNGTWRNNITTGQADFYSTGHALGNEVADDAYPWETIDYYESPLDRVKRKTGPGETWGEDRALGYSYLLNDLNDDEVLIWELQEGLQASGKYATGELQKVEMTDEDRHKTIEFIDKLGQTILKRVQVHKNEDPELWADTYYIYNDYGNLSYILPPEAVKKIGSPSIPYTVSPDLLKLWAFQYKYDDRNRIIEKRVPGSDWVYMIYDGRDRLVLTQDGNQRDPNKTTGREWSFTKYDRFNRPVATGIYTHSVSATRAEMQAVVDVFYNTATGNSDKWHEEAGTTTHGYTSRSFPDTASESDYLTITYYDSYDFKSLADFGPDYDYDATQLGPETCAQGTYSFPSKEFSRVRGLSTGNKIKVQDGNNTWLCSVTYYDDRYRVIQTITENHFGSKDKYSTLYNFPGWILATKTSHQKDGEVYGIKKRYTYDHTGRLMQGYHELIKNDTSQGEVLLAENKYNELGELIEKNLHVENNGPHQSIDYRYNIRGWLESVNSSTLQIDPERNVDDANPDLFGMELLYNHPLNGVPAGN
ncbi:hypothetical protein GCM10009122_37880 [Fulvivirga kasyanovii]|uniref:RHS repeat protein n=1 Tax=Fulvivirga kasyanovii TaxID=396812 RepID=A0ABW9RJZ5_9BACT|nr:DUF6443 domain-containing protein [Fulvivirga kasyanovii]MTI24407.1 hypothetical protein [Fulvivirga kasyanovii]